MTTPSRPGQAAAPEQSLHDEILRHDWYHSIEVAPSLFTPGKDHQNIWLTRQLLKGCDVVGQKCLDIGAMDCLTTILLKRRGAANVVAHDIVPRQPQIDLLRRALQLNFSYVSGVWLSGLRPVVRALGCQPFDIVVCSGVLYHVFDPLGTLATLRGMVRDGGLFILETAAALTGGMAAHFNAAGRFYAGRTYWALSIDCLDYLLRLLRLAPLDCICFGNETGPSDPPTICRFAIVCRAVDKSLPCAGDRWMADLSGLHFTEFIDWSELSIGAPEVGYRSTRTGLIHRPDTATVDLYETARTMPAACVDKVEEQVRLKLGARY